MAAQDYRLYVDWPYHPKRIEFRRLCGDLADKVEVCLFINLYAAVRSSYPTGNLAGKSDGFIEALAGWHGEPGKFVQILREARLLDGEESRSRIHGWEEFQPLAFNSSKLSKTNSENAKERWRQVREDQEEEARQAGTHKPIEWSAMLEAHDFKCANPECESGDEPEKDHVIPLGKPGCSYAISNLQPLCRSCNASKKSKTVDYRRKDWREAIGKILSRMRSQCESHADCNAPTNQPTNRPEATPKSRSESHPPKRPVQCITSEAADAAWKSISDGLRSQLNPHSYDTWIKPLRGYSIDGKVLLVEAPVREFGNVPERYREEIERAIRSLSLSLDSVQIIVPAVGQ